MKRQIAIIGLVLAVACVGFFGSSASGGGGGCFDPITTERTSAVRIKSFCFHATVALVETGATVTWTNEENVQHNVALVNTTWNSKGLGLKDSVSYRFEKPGVYPYTCRFHPGMSGAVVVGEPQIGRMARASVGTPTGFTNVKRNPEGTGPAPVAVQSPDEKSEREDFQPAASRNEGGAFYVFLIFVAVLMLAGVIFLALNRRSGSGRA